MVPSPIHLKDYLGRQALKQATTLQRDKYVKEANEYVGAPAVSGGQWDC